MRSRGERGAAPPAVVVLLGLVAGAVAGVVLERAQLVDPAGEPVPTVLRIDSVSAFDCPAGVPVAALARGDRVLATGRTVDGDWVEIRSPLQLGGRVWVPSEAIGADPLSGGIDDLPLRECAEETTTTAPSSTSTSSTSTSTSSTTTSTTLATTTTTIPNSGPLIARLDVLGWPNGVAQPPGSTTSTTSSSTTSTSTSSTVPTPTTTLPPGSFTYVHVEGNTGGCAVEAQVAVFVGDPEGVQSVRVDWSTEAAVGAVNLSAVSGTEWRGTIRFPASAVPPGVPFRIPTFFVTAVDGLGLAANRSLAPTPELRVFGADALPCNR
jgi:hypothetical protein